METERRKKDIIDFIMINNMMKTIALLMLLIPGILYAQVVTEIREDSIKKGINFISGMSWHQILTKAKVENKHVFVDCYTTWCGPCKEMDKSVYLVEKVGSFFSDKFISVKMQMDSSKNDDEYVKGRYADAHYVQEHYKINAYPMFLFFNPDGRIINRDEGLKTPDDFLALGTEAADSSKDYYKLLGHFRHGKRDFTEMEYLAHMGLKLDDSVTAQQVAKEYISLLKDGALLTKDNIRFMQEYTKSSKDRGFSLFYRSADSIDRLMEDDTYCEQLITSILYKEMVIPELDKIKQSPSAVPDWDRIQTETRKKYNNYYAERVITGAKASWGFDHKNLQEYTKWLVLFQEKFGSKSNHSFMASWALNDYAWAIFLYSNNEEELKKALSWSCRAVMMSPTPNWMDTYANILSKLGRNQEAILWEKIAIKLSPNDKAIQNTLAKMEKGLSPNNTQ